tara:strand:- start:4 stop:426 length:423 start_codon:yes stop_codon:yes gene_type:complete
MYFEIHPIIVHFPIAFITLAYVFQVITIIIPNKVPKNLNLWVLIPAALSTLPAVISGQNAKKNLEDICLEAQNTLKNHELFANITTWSILLLSLIWIFITLKGYANLRVQKLFCAFLSLVFISVVITGFLGGQLTHLWEV